MPGKTLTRARNSRRNPTQAERRLWGYLRNRALQGFKFNRQVPIGPFIADFVCHEVMLIVEVDGATHGDAHEIQYDEKRTSYLNTQGYRVIRCFNIDIFENLDGVLDKILIEIHNK